MKSYSLEFHNRSAEKEWLKLPVDIRKKFLAKLDEVSENRELAKPLRGDLSGFYKIVLKKSGYRLVYEFIDDELVIVIISSGKRSNSDVYETAKDRI